MSVVSFRWIDRTLVDDVAEKVVARVGDEVLADAIANCPVDFGTLANSLGRTDPRDGPDGVYVEVGTAVHYAPHVEFGTKFSPVPPGRVRKTGTRPFLGPALEKARTKYGGR